MIDDIMFGARDVTQRARVTVPHISHRGSHTVGVCVRPTTAASRRRSRNVYSDSQSSEKMSSTITNVCVNIELALSSLVEPLYL